MELSMRMKAIAEWLEKDQRVADIGTDHGLLPIYLAKEGFSGLIAADLRPLPLEKGRLNAAKHGVDCIDFRLSDGLENISSDEVDAVVIAGLSGETIIAILENAGWLREKTLILQPMSRAQVLRQYLSDAGYGLQEEKLIFEENRFFVLHYVRGKGKKLSDRQIHIGLSPTADYLKHLISVNQRALEGLSKSGKPGDAARLEETKYVLTLLREELENGNCS